MFWNGSTAIVVKTTGDGLLLEFASVVDAVRCAVEMQREMAERNTDLPPNVQLGQFGRNRSQ